MKSPLFSALALLMLFGLGGCNDSADVIYGTVERDRLTLTAPASELIANIHVKEGDEVKAGTLLLELDSRGAEAQVALAKANLAGADARLSELTRGARDEELAQAKASVDGANASVTEAEAQFQRTRKLVREKVLTQADMDKAIAARDRALAEQKRASEVLKELIAGTRSEQLLQAEAAVEAARAQLALAEKQLSDLKLYAARDAVVELLPWREGDRVTQGSQLVGLLALDAPYVRAYLPAPALSDLLPGAEVGVRVDNPGDVNSGTMIKAKVRRIRAEPAFTPFYALNERDRARLMYLTDIDLPQGSTLATGLAVEVVIGGSSKHD